MNVVNKFIDELRNQVKQKSIRIKINKDAINWLITNGFDSKMGARPLNRIIDKEIKRDLAKLMLFGDLQSGGVLSITVKNDKLQLQPVAKKFKIADTVEI